MRRMREAMECKCPARRSRLVWLVGAALVVVAVAGARVPTWLQLAALRDEDPKARYEAVRELGARGVASAKDEIRSLITSDPAPEVREAAARSAMKLGDVEALAAIREAVEKWPADEWTARMLVSYAQLGGPSEANRAFVERCGASGNFYLRVGAAMARIEWYDPAGMDRLFALALEAPDEAGPFVCNRIQWYFSPALHLIGGWVDMAEPWNAERISGMQRWWAANGSERLLAGSLKFRQRPDADTYQIQRLIHARERVAEMLGL
jgi:hypothetical protein